MSKYFGDYIRGQEIRLKGLIQEFRYRAEIDGLRAVAVMAVVLYHAKLGFPGGFVGVDVFFVISGFLITSLILKDLQEGKFTLSNFWERRARRILPALVVVVVFTVVAGWFLLLPDDYEDLGRSAAFQAAFAANIDFWRSTGYFAGAAEEKPLLHTWSLAVEEQFYLFVPLVLFGLHRSGLLQKRGVLRGGLMACILLSLIYSIYAVSSSPLSAFYLLPSRAWELMLGCLIAVAPAPKLHRFWAELFCWIGLACLVLCFSIYTARLPFPGVSAMLPCLGAALFLWASGRQSDGRDQGERISTLPSAARLLAAKPIVFVGLISYSFYLWHWPFFAFSNYWRLEPAPLGTKFGFILLGFALAVVSWRYIETPFRTRRLCPSRKAIFAFGAVGLTLVFSLGAIVYAQNGFRERKIAGRLGAEDQETVTAYRHQMNAAHVKAGSLALIGIKDPAAPIWGVVWGDSHAMAAAPGFNEFMLKNGLAGRLVTHSSTAPLLGYYQVSPDGLSAESIPFGEAIVDYVRQKQVAHVFLVGAWSGYRDTGGRGNMEIEVALMDTVARIRQAGAEPWIMLEVPRQPHNVPRLLARARMMGFDYSHYLARRTSFNGLHGQGSELLNRIEQAGGRLIDPRPSIFDESRDRYAIERDGIPLYVDRHHLSVSGARLLLPPLLGFSFGTSMLEMQSGRLNTATHDDSNAAVPIYMESTNIRK